MSIKSSSASVKKRFATLMLTLLQLSEFMLSYFIHDHFAMIGYIESHD